MSTKFIRFAAVFAILVSVIGNTAIVRADRGPTSSVNPQNPDPLRVPVPQPLTTSPVVAPGIQFVHVATAANIVAHQTFIDNPLTNDKPLAVVLVTQNWSPGGVAGANHNHYIGVVYSNTRKQWGIYNEDGAAMTVGDAFNVIIPPAGPGVFVQSASNNSNSTIINNPLANGNPNAVLLVTPIWNPGGGVSGLNANFPFSVEYNTITNNWAIFDQSGAAMPIGTSFNVFVLAAGVGIFVHTASVGNTGIYYTKIDNPLTNGHPNAMVFITPDLTSGGLSDEHPTGVEYASGYWYIANQDSVNMPVGAAFDVLVLVYHADIFVHKAAAGNSVGDQTLLDNALTNSQPNSIIFSTPNLNPGGGGGTYDNHNIGVTFNGSQWRIFNQNGSSIPVKAAFNVLVPNQDASVFVHTATANNITGDHTAMDYPLTNGSPNAIIFVTQNYNPGNVGGSSDDHPIGVEYFSGKWWIYNQDGAAMPPGAAFNVTVPKAVPGVAVFVHTATGVNSSANFTMIDNPLANGNPNAIILVMPNWNPGSLCACVNANFPIGVGYVGDIGIGRWAIMNQNGPSSSIPLDAAFNVYVFPNLKQYIPMVRR